MGPMTSSPYVVSSHILFYFLHVRHVGTLLLFLTTPCTCQDPLYLIVLPFALTASPFLENIFY